MVFFANNVIKINSIKVFGILALSLLTACSYKPMPEAISILDDSFSKGLAEQRNGFVLFKPLPEQTREACFIFYPGGLVDELSYVPMLKDIANQGFPAYLLSLPLDLAFLSMDAAQSAKDDDFAREHCQRFVISGHSLGGVAAASFVKQYPKDSLLLLASYPREGKPLLNHKGKVTSVYASNDGLVTYEDIEKSKALLPERTRWIEIKGGNHAQFGWYGEQKKDSKSDISRLKQQQQTVEAAISLLKAEPI